MKEILISKPKENKTTVPNKPPKILRPSIFSRIASVIIGDVVGFVRRKRQTDMEWEDYKKFCELARGE